MGELKYCPFCRGKALGVVSQRYTPTHYFIQCEQCRARSFYFRTPEEAVAAWNRRDKEDSLEEVVEKMLDMLVEAQEEIQNLYGKETRLTEEITTFFTEQGY